MLLDYLPPFMQDIREINKIMTVYDPEMDLLYQYVLDILNSMFVLETNEFTITLYEDMLGVVPKLTDSLQKRQADILAIYNYILPFTYENLILLLNSMCGEDGYTIDLNYKKFLLSIELSIQNAYLFDSVMQTLEKVVPMNILFELTIDYNVWSDLLDNTWSQASNYTWSNIRESEELKNG